MLFSRTSSVPFTANATAATLLFRLLAFVFQSTALSAPGRFGRFANFRRHKSIADELSQTFVTRGQIIRLRPCLPAADKQLAILRQTASRKFLQALAYNNGQCFISREVKAQRN
jgi:hypothetical protein